MIRDSADEAAYNRPTGRLRGSLKVVRLFHTFYCTSHIIIIIKPQDITTSITERSQRVESVFPPVSRLAEQVQRPGEGRAVTWPPDCPSTHNYTNYAGLPPENWKIFLLLLCLLYTSRCV